MAGRNNKPRTSSLPLFLAGTLIFICGLLLFIFDRSTPTFIYTVIMCGCGIVFILIAMIRDFALKSQRMGKNNEEKDKNNEN